MPPELEVERIRVIDGSGQREFFVFERSAPPITILNPTDGAELGERTEVAWDITDPDTPLSDLLFQITHSPDGGDSWVPIAIDVTGNGIVFDSTQTRTAKVMG